MRMKSSDIAPEFRKTTTSNVRVKDAPAAIGTAKQAVEAFNRIREYRRLEFNAHTTAMQRAGSETGRLSADRSEKYNGAAEAWETVLETWLASCAASRPMSPERDDGRNGSPDEDSEGREVAS